MINKTLIRKWVRGNMSFNKHYCEILFIRGDPIFVVFVDGLAHEFKIPRIINTISNIIVTIIFKLPILGCTSIDIC